MSKLALIDAKRDKSLSLQNQRSKLDKQVDDDNEPEKENKQDQDDDYMPPDLVGIHFCSRKIYDGKRKFLLDYCKQDHD